MDMDNKEMDVIKRRKRKKAGAIAVLIVVFDVIVLYLGTSNLLNISIIFSVCSVGVITFIGILMLVNAVSESSSFDMGEMRKAITGSFIVVYFAVMALLVFRGVETVDNELSKTIIEHFTYLMGIIIVFYFGSRGVIEYLKYKNKTKNSD